MLAVVAALNLASEVVSFTKVIDRTPPLRYLDRLGRFEPDIREDHRHRRPLSGRVSFP